MTVHAWPATRHFYPQSLRLGVRAPSVQWSSYFTGQRQSLLHAGAQRLRASMVLPPVKDREQAAQREAFLLTLAGNDDLVSFGHFLRPRPLGTFGGPDAAVAANAGVGATSVQIASARSRPNMLRYWGFENDADVNGVGDGWNTYQGAVTATAPAWSLVTHDGRNGQKFGCTALNGDQVGIVMQTPYAAVSPGQLYAMSAWVVANYTSLVITFDMYYRDGGGSLVGEYTQNFSSPASWTRVQMSSTAPANAATVALYIWFSGTTEASPHVYADDVQLEAAAAATTFAGPPTLLAGDVLKANGQLLQCAYAGATGIDGGAITMPLAVPLRKALTAGQPVTWDAPTAEWQLLRANDLALDYIGGRGVQQPLTLDFAEVL